MRLICRLTILSILFGTLAAVGLTQPPKDKQGGPPKGPGRGGPGEATSVDAIVARMMAFDKNNDGKLTRDEITDERLLRLFDQADTNKDGVVTKEELMALAAQLAAEAPAPGGRPGGFGGPGGGGPGGFGPGGPGG